MKFGLSLQGCRPAAYAEVAAAAEEAGFESVWLPEHLMLPATLKPQYPYAVDGKPGIDSTTPMYDPWVALAFAASSTTRLRLATGVYILPLRHPFVTARSVVTLDRFSSGRVVLGVGVGWLEAEFASVGCPFSERGRRTDEIIEVLRRLWTEDIVTHEGQSFSFGAVRCEPKPVNPPGPPIEVGGSSLPALRRAGRLGDGWIEIGCRSVDELARKVDIVHREREVSGREHLPFEVTTSDRVAFDPASRVECREAGVTRIVVRPTARRRMTPSELVDWIMAFGADVIAPEAAACPPSDRAPAPASVRQHGC